MGEIHMRILGSLIFGAAALFAATFATAAPAKADSFGVYVATNGFGVSFNNYDDDYYYAPVYRGGYYASYGGYNRCWDRWYRRHHRHCWNYGGYGAYGYYPYYRPYYRPGFHGYGHYPIHRRYYRHDRWYPRQGWNGNWGHREGWRGGWHGDRGREWRGHGRGHGGH